MSLQFVTVMNSEDLKNNDQAGSTQPRKCDDQNCPSNDDEGTELQGKSLMLFPLNSNTINATFSWNKIYISTNL